MRDRAAGFRRLGDLLAAGPVKTPAGVPYPGLYVSRRCPNTIREWNHLRFKEGFRNEYAPGSLVGDDHAADAARYGAMTRPRASDPEPVCEAPGRDGLTSWQRRLIGSAKHVLRIDARFYGPDQLAEAKAWLAQ